MTESVKIESTAHFVQGFMLVLLLAGTAFQARAEEDDNASGLSLSAGYTGDLRRNTTGGLATGTAYSNLLDLGATWSSNTLFSDARVTTQLSVMHVGGDGISGLYVGDMHGVNNIEAPTAWHLYEAWTEFGFGDARTTLRAGLLDLNADFDTPVTTALFEGSAHGIGTDLSQTGRSGPAIWPVTGLGGCSVTCRGSCVRPATPSAWAPKWRRSRSFRRQTASTGPRSDSPCPLVATHFVRSWSGWSTTATSRELPMSRLADGRPSCPDSASSSWPRTVRSSDRRRFGRRVGPVPRRP